MSRNENWLPHPTILDLEVSDLGRVRSLAHRVEFTQGNKWGAYHTAEREFPSRVLKDRDNGKGYRSLNRGNRTLYIHRLVAETFLPNPLSLPEVNHKDGDKGNNRPNNLEWVSREDNMTHAREVLGALYRIPPDRAREALEMRLKGAKMSECARYLGVRSSTVWNMFNSRFPNEPWKGKKQCKT